MQYNPETRECYAQCEAVADGEEILLMTLLDRPTYLVSCWVGDDCRWAKDYTGANALERAVIEYNKWARVREYPPHSKEIAHNPDPAS